MRGLDNLRRQSIIAPEGEWKALRLSISEARRVEKKLGERVEMTFNSGVAGR